MEPYFKNDPERLDRIAVLLKRKGETVTVAESSTGGLLSAELLSVPGASAYYSGGSVIYTLPSRRALLGISREDVAGLEPLTEAMALAFARAAREKLPSTWAIAELGVAGPTGAAYGHPPGISVIGIDGPKQVTARIETGISDRVENMNRFTAHALALLESALTTTTP